MKTAILSLIIALLVGVFSFLQFERNQNFMVSTENQMIELQKALSQQTDEVQESLHAAKQVSEKQAALTLAEVQAQVREQPKDWALIDAEHLVQLAYERLQFSQDVATAEQLLASADAKIQSLNNPGLNNLREALAKDRLALQAVKLPDVTGLWLNLGAMIDQVSNLPTRGLRTAYSPSSNTTTQTATTTETEIQEKKTWKQTLWESLKNIQALVKVQHHTKPIEPLLEPTEQLLATEHLKLLLEEARWAVLHGNEVVYKKSLETSLAWLQAYFETSDEKTKKFAESLQTFTQVDLKPSLPDLQPTLALFESRDK